MQKFCKKVWKLRKKRYLCTPIWKTGVCERHEFWKRLCREVLNCELSFEKFFKKVSKKFADSEKSLTFATPIQKRVWRLKMIRGSIQGRRLQIQLFDLFWDGCKADEVGREELPCGNDRPTSESNAAGAQKKQRERSLKRLRFSTRSKYRETKEIEKR